MSLKPKDHKISDIFSDKQYSIDFYQREYKWNDNDRDFKPVTALLDDIFYRFLLDYKKDWDINDKNIDSLEWYYLNSYMTNEIDGKVYIVDGQQRLTTLTLILIKLYHMSKKQGLNKAITEYIQGKIFGTSLDGRVFWMGFRDRLDSLQDIYDHNLNFNHTPANSSQINIYSNYQIIDKILSSRLDTNHKLEFFIKYLFMRIFLIEIKIDKPKDVAMVFEVINDRGIPLKAYEILKGKLLGQIHKTDVDKYIKIWEDNISKFDAYEEKEIDYFFSFYFRSKYAENAEQYRQLEIDRYHRTIFKDEWNKKIKLKHNELKAKDFIENKLTYYVDIYCEILKHDDHYSKEYEYIYFNSLNDQDSQYPLVLSATNLNDPQRDEKLKLVPKLFDKYFTILNLTGCYKSNVLNQSMIKLTDSIRNQGIPEIEQIFNKSLLDDINKIKNRQNISNPIRYDFFSSMGYTNLQKGFLRYYFARIEHFLAEGSKLPFAGYYELVAQARGKNVHHIEHILADTDANKKLFKTEDEYEEQRNRLGGLLLMKGSDNQSSKNESYKNKLKTYSGNGTLFAQTLRNDFYKSNKGFSKLMNNLSLNFKPYPDFDKKTLEERHKLLFEITKIIWT